MSLDQRLRSASREIHETVSGRPRPRLAVVARRRSRTAALTSIAAVSVALVTVALWTGADSPDRHAADSAPTATATEAPTTVAPPSTTTLSTDTPSTVSPVGDGLSELGLVPDAWTDELASGDDVLLLAEQGIAIVAPRLPEGFEGSATPVDHVPGLVTRVSLVDSFDKPGLPEFWAAFALTRDDVVRVYGTAPTGTRAVELRWGDGRTLSIDTVYQRPEADVAVYVDSIDLSALTAERPAPLDAIVWDAEGRPVEYQSLEIWSVSSVEEAGAFAGLFEVDQPLVAGQTQDTELPVVECAPPSGIATPPNQAGDAVDLGTFPTATEALQAFLSTDPGDPPLAESGYLEAQQDDGSIAYAVPYEGGSGFVTVVWVIPTDAGWQVSHWEASGC